MKKQLIILLVPLLLISAKAHSQTASSLDSLVVYTIRHELELAASHSRDSSKYARSIGRKTRVVFWNPVKEHCMYYDEGLNYIEQLRRNCHLPLFWGDREIKIVSVSLDGPDIIVHISSTYVRVRFFKKRFRSSTEPPSYRWWYDPSKNAWDTDFISFTTGKVTEYSFSPYCNYQVRKKWREQGRL